MVFEIVDKFLSSCPRQSRDCRVPMSAAADKFYLFGISLLSLKFSCAAAKLAAKQLPRIMEATTVNQVNSSRYRDYIYCIALFLIQK